MKKFTKLTSILLTFVTVLTMTVCFVSASESQSPSNICSSGNDIAPYSYRETLPVRYEVWYDKTQGEIYRNYVYRTFTFAHGYTATETWEKIDLSALEYEFYDKAYLVTVTYDFY